MDTALGHLKTELDRRNRAADFLAAKERVFLEVGESLMNRGELDASLPLLDAALKEAERLSKTGAPRGCQLHVRAQILIELGIDEYRRADLRCAERLLVESIEASNESATFGEGSPASAMKAAAVLRLSELYLGPGKISMAAQTLASAIRLIGSIPEDRTTRGKAHFAINRLCPGRTHLSTAEVLDSRNLQS